MQSNSYYEMFPHALRITPKIATDDQLTQEIERLNRAIQGFIREDDQVSIQNADRSIREVRQEQEKRLDSNPHPEESLSMIQSALNEAKPHMTAPSDPLCNALIRIENILKGIDRTNHG